ncbi:SDR family oxidoreductase [Sporocytophaga myxococcoides]|uniref:SDR family oxidoreductase n=1 Tax=Sporocytophaga myxococcoides TaxID=153721 RepID=UPI00040A5BCB|nr:SDR family oxidoreductase [Sporocytophaga myxococcoides]
MSKIVLVTGASSGIGKVIADYLTSQGHIVYGTSRSIKQEGLKFKALPMDVCDNESVKAATDHIIKKNGKIDVVINNAGIGIAGGCEYLSLSDAEKVMSTNFIGVVRVCQAVLPSMRNNKSGLIINISSIASEMGLPYRSVYSSSKAAVDRYTEALRIETKKFGIKACCIQPGGIKTDISANRLFTQVPEGSPYKDSFNRAYDAINKSVSKGLEPEIFGPLIESIMKADKVKRIYRVGKVTEKLSVLIKKIVPDYMFERIIAGFYKI